MNYQKQCYKILESFKKAASRTDDTCNYEILHGTSKALHERDRPEIEYQITIMIRLNNINIMCFYNKTSLGRDDHYKQQNSAWKEIYHSISFTGITGAHNQITSDNSKN